MLLVPWVVTVYQTYIFEVIAVTVGFEGNISWHQNLMRAVNSDATEVAVMHTVVRSVWVRSNSHQVEVNLWNMMVRLESAGVKV